MLVKVGPTGLISFSGRGVPRLPRVVSSCRRDLRQRNVHVRVVYKYEGRCLLLICQPSVLRRCLGRSRTEGLLLRSKCGVSDSLSRVVTHLGREFFRGARFPRRVKLFLNCPVRSIGNFQGFKNDNYGVYNC